MVRLRNARKEIALAPWTMCEVAPGAPTSDAWMAAPVPGTVAEALSLAGKWNLDLPSEFDTRDFIYRTTFAASAEEIQGVSRLVFEGLATIADVTLNGVKILHAESMFHDHVIDTSTQLKESNELELRFSSLKEWLSVRRARPRWKTRMVAEQQMRWCRTSFLGRMPGWSPSAPCIGPYRGVRLETGALALLTEASVRPSFENGHASIELDLTFTGAVEVQLLLGGSPKGSLEKSPRVHVRIDLPDVLPWSPEEPNLYEAVLAITRGNMTDHVSLGKLGFREVTVARGNDGGSFQLAVNGKPFFARGACWTTADFLTRRFVPGPHDAVALAKAAGMNLLRVGGTMDYECDEFYRRCDELGILVWQDFMFANLDYPADNPEFRALVTREAMDVTRRLRVHPCLAVFCGGSEVAQQAAMLGLPREQWSNALFDEVLPGVVRAEFGDSFPYVPSSPWGGALPFHANAGITHYYGVGAYLRPIEDSRRADVRFASECLAFANVPDPSTIDRQFGKILPAVHHPRWKERSPRDHGAGWDFDDVRDHYLKELFAVDPVALRYSDQERFLALSRVVSAEIMERTIAEWRRKGSRTSGCLVWYLNDLLIGAGWGVIDATGRPKAAYYGLRRAYSPTAMFFVDEGVNGLYLHAVNDTAADRFGTLELKLFRGGSTLVKEVARPLSLPKGEATAIHVDEWLEGFFDPTYAYRFGPRGVDLIVARFANGPDAQPVEQAFYSPLPLSDRITPATLMASVTSEAGMLALAITSDVFARSIAIDVPGFFPSDNYFHLAPGEERRILLSPLAAASAFRGGSVQALNSTHPLSFRA